jgi:hypothetical protein
LHVIITSISNFDHYIWKILIYILLTAIGLMPSGSVYKVHKFYKETAHTSHENSTYIARITTQVHEHYKTQQKTENTEENKINILSGNKSGPSSL